MRKRTTAGLLSLIMTTAMIAAAAPKITGTATLKDFQPAGTTGKNHKHQQYDFFFAASGQEYTCRSSEKKTLKATDFVVGSNLAYQIQGTKGKVTGSNGKQVDCTIVRVANAQTM